METLDGDNKYDAGEYGLQVSVKLFLLYIYQYNSLSKVSDEDFITVTKGAFQRSYVFGQTSQIIFKNYPKTHLLYAHHLGINWSGWKAK